MSTNEWDLLAGEVVEGAAETWRVENSTRLRRVRANNRRYLPIWVDPKLRGSENARFVNGGEENGWKNPNWEVGREEGKWKCFFFFFFWVMLVLTEKRGKERECVFEWMKRVKEKRLKREKMKGTEHKIRAKERH